MSGNPIHDHHHVRLSDQVGSPTELERRLDEVRGGIEIELGKMSLKPGDVVVLKLPRETPTENIEAVAQYVNQVIQPTGATWIGLFEGQEIEHVTAEEMARLGWVRAQ